jgi:mitogen-activated protein kinase 1/3
VNDGPVKISIHRLAGTDSNDSNFINIEKKKAEMANLDLMNICLVIEFIDTDLDSLLKHKIDFNENHLTKLLYNTLCSLAFIHMCNVMHRDLKPANILI